MHHLGAGGIAAASALVIPTGDSSAFNRASIPLVYSGGGFSVWRFSASPRPWRTVRSSVVGALDGALQALRIRKRKIPSSLLAFDTRRLRSDCAEVLSGLSNQQRVILIVHIRLNPIALPDVYHY